MFKPFGVVDDEGDEEILFALEVEVEATGSESGALNNLFNSERLETFDVDQFRRRRHELLPHDGVWGTEASPSAARLLNHLNLCQMTPIGSTE